MKLTKTQQLLMDVLQDGKPHTKEELLAVMIDPLSSIDMVKLHICLLRKKLRPNGHDVLLDRKGYTNRYRLVRLVGSVDE